MSAKSEERSDRKIVVENRRARHNYAIEQTYEAGMALQGSEVKALREGKGQIAEAYAMVREGEVFIHGMHISPYSGASTHVELDPVRPRKLLLRRKEIDELSAATQQKGMTLVPLRVYFSHGLAKMELGIARGKQNVDKRRSIAEREAKREMERTTRRRQKGV
jgi:SsrA-binding protein